jgi:hypothetical protein
VSLPSSDGFLLHHGDCLDMLRGMADSSVDSVVTDPPYGLSDHKPAEVVECLTAWLAGEPYTPKGKGFMGKGWDAWVPGPEVWRECLRVLKPGGHLLAFAGTRSMDLMCMSVRLAGFELRDSIGHASDGGDTTQAHHPPRQHAPHGEADRPHALPVPLGHTAGRHRSRPVHGQWIDRQSGCA